MGLAGHHPDVVISAIIERRRRRQQGDTRTDGRKIGLVVEGGAMRGVRSAGGLIALERLGLTDLFDEVYGTSAGAFNAAYFLAGQAALGASVYYEDLIDSRFINLLRVGKLVDVDYVLSVISGHKALNVSKVMASRSKLFVPLLDADSGKGFLVHAQASRVPLLTLLRASGALPIAYNRTVDVDGRACFDAGWANSIPIRSAIDHQCTDVLVLLTQPDDYREPPARWIERWAFDLAGYRSNANLKQTFLQFSECANELRDLALGRLTYPPELNIATIVPGRTGTAIHAWIKDAPRLKAAAEEYAATTWQAFRPTVAPTVKAPHPQIEAHRPTQGRRPLLANRSRRLSLSWVRG